VILSVLPPWMTAEQRAAALAGVARADEDCAAAAEAPPVRIAHDDIVSFRPPAFLTMDYDPTHRPRTRR